MSFHLSAFTAWDQRIIAPHGHRSPARKGSGAPIPHRPQAPTRGLSPLTTGILAENLRLLDNGRGVGVRLWDQWPGMFAGLPALGEVLIISCSECAVLGKYMDYPPLNFDLARGLAGDFEGKFDFEFAALAAADPLHLRSSLGHNYSIEFLHANGRTLHKICLSTESSFDAFLEWEQIHQSVEIDPAPSTESGWFDSPATSGAGYVPSEAHVLAELAIAP